MIKYDTPIEVTKEQYPFLMANFSGIIAGRFDEPTGKYYIKVWVMKYAKEIEKQITNL